VCLRFGMDADILAERPSLCFDTCYELGRDCCMRGARLPCPLSAYSASVRPSSEQAHLTCVCIGDSFRAAYVGYSAIIFIGGEVGLLCRVARAVLCITLSPTPNVNSYYVCNE
jgi:hypothetical protein